MVAALVFAATIVDARAEPAGPWTGFYIGVHGGQVAAAEAGTLGYNDPAFPGITAADIFASTSRSIKATGWLGGLHAGYNYQAAWLVFGVEADMAHVDVTGTTSATSVDTFTTWSITSKFHSLGTLRGRLGLAAGPVLLYGTAGLAWALVDTSNAWTCVGCPVAPWGEGKSNESHLGVAAGGGIEWMISEHWVVRAEYLFMSFGSVGHTFVGTAHSGTVPVAGQPGLFEYRSDSLRHDLQAQSARLGLSFKF